MKKVKKNATENEVVNNIESPLHNEKGMNKNHTCECNMIRNMGHLEK